MVLSLLSGVNQEIKLVDKAGAENDNGAAPSGGLGGVNQHNTLPAIEPDMIL